MIFKREIMTAVVAWLVLACTGLAQKPIEIAKLNRTTPVSFENEILPLLQKNCLACHSASEGYGDLVLETPKEMLAGGDSGPAIVAGKGLESLLLKVAAHQEEPLMPPPDNDVAAVNLTPQQLGLIKLWIDQGARSTGLKGLFSPTEWRPLPPGTQPIYAVAVTPDGQFAACGRANQIFIYHVPTGRLVTRLTDPDLQAQSRDGRPGIAHLDVIQSLAFNQQGDRLASGGFRTAKIWRYPRDVRRHELPAANKLVTAVAVAPDQGLVATASGDHVIRLWNAADAKSGAELAGHTDRVTAIRFSRDGERIYSASLDGAIRVWNTADGSLLGTILSPDPVAALTTFFIESPADDESEGKSIEKLVSASGNFLQSWRIPAQPVAPLADTLADASLMSVSDDGQYLALANAEGKIQIHSLASNEIVSAFAAGEADIRAMAFRPAAKPSTEEGPEVVSPSDVTTSVQLALGRGDGRVQLFDIASGEVVSTFHGSLAPITSLVFHPTENRLTAGDETGQVTEWSLDSTGEGAWEASVTADLAVVSRDGKLLATAETSGGRPAIVVRDIVTGTLVATLLGHTDTISALAFNADGTMIASGSTDNTTRVWDLREPRFPQAARFDGHDAEVTAVAFNADSSRVLSGATDGSLTLWTVANVEEFTSFAGHSAEITGVAMIGGSQPVSSSIDKTIRFWNAADGKPIRSVSESMPVTSLALSNDSAKLAASVGSETKLYQAADAEALPTLSGSTSQILSVSFNADASRVLSVSPTEAVVHRSADGRLLEMAAADEPFTAGAIRGDGQSIMLSNAASQQSEPLRFTRSFDGIAGEVTKLAYRADGQLLLASSVDGTVRGFTSATGAAAFNTNLGGPVTDMRLRPDGQAIACAMGDKVRMLNATNGAALQPTEIAAVGPVTAVGFSAEGSRIVVASAGDTPQMIAYRTADGSSEQILMTEAVSSVTSSLLSTDAMIALSAKGLVIRPLLLADQRFAGHTGEVTSLAAVSGSQVVSGGLDGTLRHWDLSAATPLIRTMNHGGPVLSVAAHADAGRFASVSENHTARLWNLANGQQLAEMKGDIRAKELVAKINLRKADLTAKVATAKTSLEAAQKEVPIKTEAEKQAATALATAEKDVTTKRAALDKANLAKVAAEKDAIAAAAAAQIAALKMREANQKATQLAAQVARMNEQATRARTLAQANPGNEQLAVISQETNADLATLQEMAKAAEAAKAQPTQQANATAKVADAAAAKVVQLTKPYADAAAALATAEGDLRIAEANHVIAKRDLEQAKANVPSIEQQLAATEEALAKTEEELAKAILLEEQAQQPLRTVDFAPDGLTLATGGDIGVIHTWSAESGKAVSSYHGHEGQIEALAFLGNNTIASGGADENAILWDANPAWELERTIGSITDPTLLIDRVSAVAFSHNGELLATGGGVPSRTGEVKLWKVEDGSLHVSIPEAHTDGVNDVAFSADDAYLASAAADKFIRTWRVDNGERVHQFEGHTGHALGVSWRANGQMLASSGADGTVRTWNATNGDRIRTIQGYQKQVTDLRFIGQTQFLVAVSGDPIVRMHNADNGGTQRNFASGGDYMYAVDVTPDSAIVVAAGHDGMLRIWNGTNGQVLHTIGAPSAEDQSISSN